MIMSLYALEVCSNLHDSLECSYARSAVPGGCNRPFLPSREQTNFLTQEQPEGTHLSGSLLYRVKGQNTSPVRAVRRSSLVIFVTPLSSYRCLLNGLSPSIILVDQSSVLNGVPSLSVIHLAAQLSDSRHVLDSDRFIAPLFPPT